MNDDSAIPPLRYDVKLILVRVKENSESRLVSRVLFLDDYSSGTFVTKRLKRSTLLTVFVAEELKSGQLKGEVYLILLQVGFAAFHPSHHSGE